MEVVSFSSGVLLSGFSGEIEAGLPIAPRTVERNFGVPIAGHVDLDFGAILAGRVRPLDAAAGVHLHSRHVHIQVELYVADIDELTIAIPKFDQHFVVALAKLTFARNELYREVVNVLRQEWRARDLCWAEFLQGKLSGVE